MPFHTLCLAPAPSTINSPIGWVVLLLVVIAGLAIGFSDVARFRLGRVWALSSLCFTESMRRKVLLITPLAILGVVVVAQLQQATDDQDAIRQTIKFCIFATGLVVTVTAIILACTSLPREIESKVIFTVVTKPTTRLEIVLGKVLGFARVSAAILLIMGLFTYIYLHARDHARTEAVRSQLAVTPEDAPNRATLAHYASNGYLETKALEFPQSISIYSSPPKDGIQWMRGSESQYFLVPFEPSEEESGTLLAAAKRGAEVDLVVNLELRRRPLDEEDERSAREMGMQREAQQASPLGPALPGTVETKSENVYPMFVHIRVLNEAGGEVLRREVFGHDAFGAIVKPNSKGGPVAVIKMLDPKDIETLSEYPRFGVEVSPMTPGVEYGAKQLPVSFFIPAANDGKGMKILPRMENGAPALPSFQSRPGRTGTVVTGHSKEIRSLADFKFRDQRPSVGKNGKVPFQLQANFERTGDFDASARNYSVIAVDVLNQKTGKSSGTIQVTPELGRPAYLDVPAEDVEGGDFDVMIRDTSDQQWVDITADSLTMVTAERTFAGNLVKSLLLLWMLSILVVAISVFCSTFLSWPIAVVFALVLLLGHWGVSELGDALNPGVGRSVSSDFQLRDPTGSKVVSSSVEGLAKMLKTVSVVLPDVANFPASGDIERGVSISARTMTLAVEALLIYGLTLVVAGYIILKFKEVAP